jgi:hypothetical protein
MSECSQQLPLADDELWSLVEALVTGSATPRERDQLEVRLRTEPPARLFYVAYLDLHAQLQWLTRGESVRPVARRPARRVFWLVARPALAASFLLAVGLLAFLLVHHGTSDEGELPELADAPAGSVAVLIDDRSAVWEKDTALPTKTGSALRPGRLKLRAGVVEVAFRAGGSVLLEGPADFEVSAADQGFLRQGKMTAKVQEGAPAFRVGMPGVIVTDLSGECGLLRDELGRTEVHVFEGQVGTEPSDHAGEPWPEKRLGENTAARIDPGQRTITPVPLDEAGFARLRPEVRLVDATVRAGKYAGRSFGTAGRLVVKNSIPDYTWETYLRFDLAEVKGKVSEAHIRLVPVRVGQPLQNAAAVVIDNRWDERTLTWDNKPPSGPPFAIWTVVEGEAVELDVTGPVLAALAGDKVLSLRIFAPVRKRGASYVQYGSREGDLELRPQLLVTTVP